MKVFEIELRRKNDGKQEKHVTSISAPHMQDAIDWLSRDLHDSIWEVTCIRDASPVVDVIEKAP